MTRSLCAAVSIVLMAGMAMGQTVTITAQSTTASPVLSCTVTRGAVPCWFPDDCNTCYVSESGISSCTLLACIHKVRTVMDALQENDLALPLPNRLAPIIAEMNKAVLDNGKWIVDEPPVKPWRRIEGSPKVGQTFRIVEKLPSHCRIGETPVVIKDDWGNFYACTGAGRDGKER